MRPSAASIRGVFGVVVCASIIACAPGCSSQSPQASTAQGGDRIVDVLFSDNQLRILGEYAPTGAAAPPDASTTGLLWTYRSQDGAVLAQGGVRDVRTATSEFDESGSPNPIDATHDWLLFSARLPGAPGTLELSAASGGVPSSGQSFQGTIGPRGISLAGGSLGSTSVGASQGQAPNAVGTATRGVTEILQGSVTCPFNVLIVPEAFQDMNAFHDEASQIASFINSSQQWSPYAAALNYWTQDFISHDTSIYDPGDMISRNTAFMTSYGGASNTPNRRMILSAKGFPGDTAAQLMQGVRASNADVVVIVVNTTEYGGIKDTFLANGSTGQGGMLYVTVTMNAQAPQVVVHELSHALLALADEYDYGTCNLQFAEAPNTSAHLDALPWQSLVTDPVPTPPGTGGVGAFQGAHYCTTGVYRPSNDCLMRELAQPFCPVCSAVAQQVFGPRLAMPLSDAPDASSDAQASCIQNDSLKCPNATGWTCTGSASPPQGNCSTGVQSSGTMSYCCNGAAGGGVSLTTGSTSLTQCPSRLLN